MNRWSWLALGVGAYLAFTLATFPATTAVRWFAPPEVAVTGIEGTLWSGGALSCSLGAFRAEGLRWRIRPWSLLLGRVAGTLEARIPDGFVSTELTATSSRVRFDALRGATSLSALAGVLPISGMRGQASLALDRLEVVDGWPTSVVGELRLADLEATPLISDGSGALVVLGDYKVTFTPAAEREVAAQFVDEGGPLAVTGTLKVDAARVYTFDALAAPRPGANEMLVQGLTLMGGEPDAEGRRRITLTGNLAAGSH
jgi:general secretion pathway protein N